MTAKTIHKRAKSKFSMKKVRKSSRKLLMRRTGKKINKGYVDRVWKSWVECMILDPLIESGEVKVDKSLTLRIVGKRIVDKPRTLNLLKNGLMALPGGGVKKITELNRTRPGMTYWIEATDTSFKEGKLIFKASSNIKKAVTKALIETNKYYTILQ